jgi:hypothetical protein
MTSTNSAQQSPLRLCQNTCYSRLLHLSRAHNFLLQCEHSRIQRDSLREGPKLIIVKHATVYQRKQPGNTDTDPACPVHVTSAMLAATFTNMECHVGLSLQAQGNKFVILCNPTQINEGIHLPSLIFTGISLCDL